MIPKEAVCSKGKLHDFEIIRNLLDALIEVCVLCGERAVYNKRGGMYDTAKHLRAHLRDTLQPYGRTGKLFREVYGTQGIETAARWGNKVKNRAKEEYQELKEKRIAFRKRAFKGSGKSNKEIESEIKRYKYKTTGLQNVK